MGLKENIKIKRQEKGMTLEELAKRIGKTKQTVQKYESGVISNISSDIVEKLANALQTTPGYLMGWDDPEKDDKLRKLLTVKREQLEYMIYKKRKGEECSIPEFEIIEKKDELELINFYRKLNSCGKVEARKRVFEMALISTYTDGVEQYNMDCSVKVNSSES